MTCDELESEINALFTNRGSFDRAFIDADEERIWFNTYVNGWIKPEGEGIKPSKSISESIQRMWDLALAEYKSGKRNVWWRVHPCIRRNEDNRRKKLLCLRAAFT